LPAVGTLIHKGYCSAHPAAEGRTTTGSCALFKFPELLGSTSYWKFVECALDSKFMATGCQEVWLVPNKMASLCVPGTMKISVKK
jgi:hypothetical protein